MSRAGWGATLLGAGIALTLLLVASPALASGMRRPNLRGRPVPVVAGVLPAVAVLLVAGIWAIQEPAGPTLGAALVAAGFGFTGGLLSCVRGASGLSAISVSVSSLWVAGCSVPLSA